MSQDREKIMLVDPDMVVALHVDSYLKGIGYDVVFVTSHRGLIAEIEYECPSILIFDPMIEGLNPEHLEGLRSHDELRDLVMVIFSAMPAKEMAQLCERYAFNGYLSKSLPLSLFDNFIKQVLQ